MKLRSLYLAFTAILSFCLTLSVLSDASVRLNLSQEQTEEFEFELEEELDNEESNQKKKTPKNGGFSALISFSESHSFFNYSQKVSGQLSVKHASKTPLFLLYGKMRIHIG